MVNQILAGSSVDVNNTETYGVPAYLCSPVGATAADLQSLLFDSGYYAWDDPDFADLREEFGA
jgi:putative multiple sugar transport system substrate-binding protein